MPEKMKHFKVALLGASGFAGAELLRRLLPHPHVEVVRVCAADHIGEPVASAHPHLEGATDLVFEDLPPEAAARGADLVVMGLPHQASVDLVQALQGSDVRVLDLSGAFRLADPEAYAQYYGTAHPCPALLSQFVYGLPELNREAIRGARYVASPGCFATTAELALLPLARAGLLRGRVDLVGVTGSSGAGATPSPTTHHPVRANNLRSYSPLTHPHSPEIEATLLKAGGRELELAFVPVSAPLTRGIFVTAFARVPAELSQQELEELYHSTYAEDPFVRVPARRLPEVVAVSGSNYAEASARLGAVRGGEREVVCFAATDNLVKGGAGQAVQNLNLMLGFAEDMMLEDRGGYP